MNSDRGIRRIAVLIVLLAAGCNQPKGVLFEPLPEPLLWPPAPETARIEYVGQLETSADLKPAKGFGKLLGEGIFGPDSSRSMLSPYALTTDGADRLFVADSNAQLVHVFDLEDRGYEQWRPPETKEGFSQPVGIAYDATGGDQGRLLVADSVGASIHVFDTRGIWRGRIGEGLLARPCGLAVDAVDGRLFVADAASHEVLIFDWGGRLINRLGTRGTGPGEFNFPTNVALDTAGRLYVADSLNFRIQIFGPDLSPLTQIGTHGDLPGSFSQPKGIALDSDGHLYVVDAHFESVQIFDDMGRLLLTFGAEGHGPGEFWLPAGIHIDADDRVWIADTYNRRVQVFQYLRSPEGYGVAE
ncbi:MAG: 6-bladed beta-propeller [Planctomycetota bacterium]